MEKTLFFILLFLSAGFAKSQRLSVDLMPGFINYGGELQPSNFTLVEARPAIQVGLDYKLGDHLFIRGTYLAGSVHGDDKKGDKLFAIDRNLNFTSIILEGSINLEYDFLKMDDNNHWSPYLFCGPGFFFFNPYTYDTLGNKVYLQPLSTEGEGLPEYPNRKVYSLYQFNIVGGAGIKYAISDKISIGFELSVRKLFTDYLDDVSTTYVDPAILLRERGPEAVELAFRGNELNPPVAEVVGSPRGNPGKDDTYYTGLLRFSYTFSPGSHYSGTNKRSISCPKKVL